MEIVEARVRLFRSAGEMLRCLRARYLKGRLHMRNGELSGSCLGGT